VLGCARAIAELQPEVSCLPLPPSSVTAAIELGSPFHRRSV
jgi:hypothetical protein